MDKRKIYDLLCEIIKEAELGKHECIRDDFDEIRLCDHAWENIDNLVEEIRKAITAEDRAAVERRRRELLAENIYPAYHPFNDFPESNNV